MLNEKHKLQLVMAAELFMKMEESNIEDPNAGKHFIVSVQTLTPEASQFFARAIQVGEQGLKDRVIDKLVAAGIAKQQADAQDPPMSSKAEEETGKYTITAKYKKPAKKKAAKRRRK